MRKNGARGLLIDVADATVMSFQFQFRAGSRYVDNKDIYETAYALGANTLQYFTHFLLKEARSGLILSFTSTAISLLSYSTVMGIIGGGGLGYLAISEGYQNFNYELMWIIIVMMVLMVQIIQTIGHWIARKYDKR